MEGGEMMDISTMSKEEFFSTLAEMVANYIETNKLCQLKAECERVSTEEAAKILGMSVNGVRIHMERNLWDVPIGYVVKNGGKNDYQIYRAMLNKHIGVE